MNLADLQRTLFEVARVNPPSEDVPYAFEKRIMAHLSPRPLPDAWTFWNRALWRAATPCVTLTLGLSIWSLLVTPPTLPEEGFESALDRTVLLAVDSSDLPW